MGTGVSDSPANIIAFLKNGEFKSFTLQDLATVVPNLDTAGFDLLGGFQSCLKIHGLIAFRKCSAWTPARESLPGVPLNMSISRILAVFHDSLHLHQQCEHKFGSLQFILLQGLAELLLDTGIEERDDDSHGQLYMITIPGGMQATVQKTKRAVLLET
ncbi:hypothetical protein H5410_058415 [Solanum commersonii]|uniref:Uncharacterized protein n=1 Tax=Solanum commersonii TaxID=4109 RepID=A0A9J5WR07_SOLCO|nr:hypothetical protein H5410_058415 [Solanum commersonii]